MKLHFLTLATLLSAPSLKAMGNGKGEFTIEAAFIVQKGDAGECTCKEREIEARRQKYEASVLEHFDETCFAPMEAKLATISGKGPKIMKMAEINKPDANGIFPLHHVLQQGNFNMAALMLDGHYKEPAKVQLNFAQKSNNPFIRTLIGSVAKMRKSLDSSCPESAQLRAYLDMKGAVVLRKLLLADASTDYHGAEYGNERAGDLIQIAKEAGLTDMAELIKLSREKKYIAMQELVNIIRYETIVACRDNK